MSERIKVDDNYNHREFMLPHALFSEGWAALLQMEGLAVLIAIWNHANYHTKKGYPSQATIARELGTSTRTVERQVQKLKAFGMIEIIPPEEKKDLFGLSERERTTNTYNITDRKTWKKPEGYEETYKRRKRNDKGKPRPERRKKQKTQIALIPSDYESDNVPTTSRIYADYKSDAIPTESRMPTDYQSDAYRLPVVQNNPNEITPGSNPNNNGAVVVDQINFLIRKTKKGDPILRAYLEKLCKIHQTTQEQVLICAQALAAIPNIRSIPAVMLGTKNGDGHYDSSCFYDGVCILAQAEPESKPAIRPAEPQRDFEQEARDLEQYIKRLDDTTRQALMRKTVTKLAGYKNRMKPEVYQETLQISFTQEVQAYADEHAA